MNQLARQILLAVLIYSHIFPFLARAQNPIPCSIQRMGADYVFISWRATPGQSYTLQWAVTSEGPWQTVATYQATAEQLISDLPIDARARFFRVSGNGIRPGDTPVNAPLTGYAFDERFANYYPFNNIVEVPQRVLAINQHLSNQGLLQKMAPLAPLSNPSSYIAQVHTADHIQSISSIPLNKGQGASETIGAIAELAVGYVLGAVREVCENNVRNAFCNIRPPGHHQINFGAPYGSCCYANAVIGARYALNHYPAIIKKVMILDWDFHHGNGTEYFVRNDPAFLFYDTCDGSFYSGGEETRHGLMHHNSGIDGFLHEWETEMIPLAKDFKPDLIIISAGFDSEEKDFMGGLGLTAWGFSILTRKVMDLAEQFSNGRIVSIFEGGYADANSGNPPTYHGLIQCIENHVRTLMTGEVYPETPFFVGPPSKPSN